MAVTEAECSDHKAMVALIVAADRSGEPLRAALVRAVERAIETVTQTPGAPRIPVDPTASVDPTARPDARAIRAARNTSLRELGALREWLTETDHGPFDANRAWGYVLAQLTPSEQTMARATYENTTKQLQASARELTSAAADPETIEEVAALVDLLLPAQRLFADLAQ